MAKQTLKLNPMQVDTAKPKEKEYSLSDGDGLYIRIKVNGTKSWIFNYTQPILKPILARVILWHYKKVLSSLSNEGVRSREISLAKYLHRGFGFRLYNNKKVHSDISTC